jgi:hypothetical protein
MVVKAKVMTTMMVKVMTTMMVKVMTTVEIMEVTVTMMTMMITGDGYKPCIVQLAIGGRMQLKRRSL